MLIHGAIAYSSASLLSLWLVPLPTRKFTTTTLLYVFIFLIDLCSDFESNTNMPMYSNRFKRHQWRDYAKPTILSQWMANIQVQHLQYETEILLSSKLWTARVTMSPSTGNHMFTTARCFCFLICIIMQYGTWNLLNVCKNPVSDTQRILSPFPNLNSFIYAPFLCYSWEIEISYFTLIHLISRTLVEYIRVACERVCLESFSFSSFSHLGSYACSVLNNFLNVIKLKFTGA